MLLTERIDTYRRSRRRNRLELAERMKAQACGWAVLEQNMSLNKRRKIQRI